MGGNETIEQPDIPKEGKEDKNSPSYKPDDFGYKKFKPEEHHRALEKAKGLDDKQDKEELKRLEDELNGLDKNDKQKMLKPEALTSLDESVKIKEEDKKAPPKEVEGRERVAFSKIMQTLQENNKIPIQAEGELHVFEFKGLKKDNKDVKPQEVEKIMEKIDKGGDMPKDIEFRFQTTFKKGREESEAVDVGYNLSLENIMTEGIGKKLSTLMSLSYEAASSYDEMKGKKAPEGVTIEKPKSLKEAPDLAALENLKKQLEKRNIQTATIQTAQWNALDISLPEKQTQLTVVSDGAVFKVTEKRQDKTVESKIQSPAEVLEYIDKISK